MVTRRLGTTFVALASIGVMACGGTDEARPDTDAADGVRVASFDFAESVLLAELYAQVIESTGVPVVRLGAIGPREVIAPALELDRIDVVPEYLGTALQHWGAPEPDPDTESALAELNSRLADRGLTALEPAPAQDKNVFVVTAQRAENDELADLSDLIGLAPDLRFGGPPECPDRPLCLAGLEDVYGLRFAEFVAQRSLTFTAEALRRDEIDVGLMFSTAADLIASDLVVLADDRMMQPAENVVPVIRSDALERWGPDVAEALDEMSARLTTVDLLVLNARVLDDEPVEAVAREWLETNELLTGN